MTTDWFRQTEWSVDHLQAFLARNARSRGDARKAQFVRIQAVTLLETGRRELAKASLQLLEDHYFPSYLRELDACVALSTAAQCCEALERIDDAIAYNERALAREAEMPGSQSSAAYHLSKLAVELNRLELAQHGLAALDRSPVTMFPWHVYIREGTGAYVAHCQGELDLARERARAALSAAAQTKSAGGRGHLGLVRDKSTKFHELVSRLAND